MNQYAIKLIDNDTRDLYEYEVHIQFLQETSMINISVKDDKTN
jgi:hypothetical protein